MDKDYANEYRENLPEQAEHFGAYEADTVEPGTTEITAPTAIVKPAAAPVVPATTGKKNKWLIIGGILFAGSVIWYLSNKKKR